MIDKVVSAIEHYKMLKQGDSVCVALSGGADSVSLLYALCSLKEKYGLSLSAAHLNHNLRGEESLRDENFVKNLCKKLNIPLTVKSEDVLSLSQAGGKSIELAAREARYAFFATLGNVKVATAHTASDNAETVLLNITRGTALKGLCGIPAVRDNFIRPLIFCTRSDVEEYCKDNSLEYVTDSTNLSDEYTRNHFRHNVVSQLKSVNASFESAVSRMCGALSVDNDYLESVSNELFDRCFDGEKLVFSEKIHRALKIRAINRLIFEKTGKFADSGHLNAVCDALNYDRRIELFSGYYAHVNFNTVRIVNLSEVSEYKVNFKKISYEEFKTLHKINKLLLNNAVDCDKISGEPIIRTRVEGDSMRLARRKVTKSLRKIYNENKISPEERNVLPVAADDDGVIWVCSVGVSERVCIDKTTKNVLIFEFEKFSK